MQSDTPGTSELAPTQFKCPVITIPEDVTVCKYGHVKFSITVSNGGVIACEHWRHGIVCEGKLEALIAAGLMLAAWTPGLPGNNKTCQRVAFDEDYPRLILCGKGGQRLKIPHISIMKKTRITFEVCIPVTEEQDAWLKAKENEGREERNKKHAAELAARIAMLTPPVKPPEPPRALTPDEARSLCLAKASYIRGYIESIFEGSEHMYGFNSMNRIKGSFDALQNAVTNAQIVRLEPKYPRVGNVVQFPLRTR